MLPFNGGVLDPPLISKGPISKSGSELRNKDNRRNRLEGKILRKQKKGGNRVGCGLEGLKKKIDSSLVATTAGFEPTRANPRDF